MYQVFMSLHSDYEPHPNGNTVLQRFECGNTIEIFNGIMFDFNPGLPHIRLLILTVRLLAML